MSPDDCRAPCIEQLLPHREPMLLLRFVREWSSDWIRCTGLIPAEGPMVIGNSASAILGIELGAQAAAAHESLRSRPSTDPARGASAGYLVSIRNADFLERSIPVGVDLRVEANLVGSAGPLAMYEVSVSREDSALLLIKAAISTMSVQSRPL